MNIAFVVDNSISMGQITYNGLSLLEYAKAYIQKMRQNRQSGYRSIVDSKNDYYHLFKTSIQQPISTYQHCESHFFCQLKLIKPEIQTNVALTIRKAFSVINKYRIANGSENILGYFEPYNPSPAFVVFFTDSCDEQSLLDLKKLINTHKLLNRYDSQFHIIKICPISFRQRNVNLESYRKHIEKQLSSKIMADICEYLGGSLKFIMKYEIGFQVLSQILMSNCKLIFKFQHIQLNANLKCFKDTGIKLTHQKTKNQLLKENQFFITSILKSTIKRMSRIPFLQRNPALNELGTSQVEFNGYPEYRIDFSKGFDYPMNQYMPFQKLQIQINDVLRQVMEKMKIQKMYFPVYFFHQQYKHLLVGLMKISKASQTTQLFVYLANFFEFSAIFDFILTKKSFHKQLQISFGQYMKKIPPFYQRAINSILNEKGYHKQVNLRNNEKIFQINETIEKLQKLEKKIIPQKLKNDSRIHSQYQSQCCPIYSKKFLQYSKSISKYKNQNILHQVVSNQVSSLINLKMQLLGIKGSAIQDQIYRFEYKSVQVVKGVELRMSQIEQGGLGNPFKKRRKDSEVFPKSNEILQLSNIEIQNEQKPREIKKQIQIVISSKRPTNLEGRQIKRISRQLNSNNNSSGRLIAQLQQKERPIKLKICSNQQNFVNKISALFQVKKELRIKFNSVNLRLESYQKNIKLLEGNSL